VTVVDPRGREDAWFENPVIPGFHPDPSICRVGNDFYLVTSSFEYFPGLPLFTSRDLVTWRQIGHVLDRPGQLDLRAAPSSGGLYAATIRWHEGHFFVTGTNVSSGGHFIVHATDPSGPWSDPVLVDQDGIDPSLFFDGGEVYFTSTVEPDPAGPHLARPAFRRGVQQCLVDPFTGERCSDTRFLWEGSGGQFPEAPHLYRKGDHYYLLLAEGGTEYGHMVTVARSVSPWGPWEPCPQNPVLSHRSTDRPVQATGHADLVELADGRWWLVCLGIRPWGHWPRHTLGRETFLAPVEWTSDGWPRVGGSGFVERRARHPFPHAVPQPRPVGVRDDFDHVDLAPQWNTLRTPGTAWWSLRERAGWLRMRGLTGTLDDLDVAFVGRRQQHVVCRVAARLSFRPGRAGEEAGLAVRMNERHHYEVGVQGGSEGAFLVLRRRVGSLSVVEPRVPVAAESVDLHVDADPEWYTFWARLPNGTRIDLGVAETQYLSSETAGGFTGVYLGMYATGDDAPSSTPAFWDWFDYEPDIVGPPG